MARAAKKKVVKKKVVARKAAKKKAVVRKAAPKKVVKKAAKKVAKKAAKKASKKIVKKAVAKRVASKKRAAPKAKPKARAAVSKRPSPPAFAAQKANASARDLLIFELVRARAAVKAAVQGLPSGGATRPIAPGKWSPLEIVLHLSERDRVRLDEFDRVLAGVPRSWATMSDGEMEAVNEAHLAPLRAHTWEEAIRRMDSLRDELMERIAALPAEPVTLWKAGHAFGDMMLSLPGHDRNHAMQIKNARIGGRAPVEA